MTTNDCEYCIILLRQKEEMQLLVQQAILLVENNQISLHRENITNIVEIQRLRTQLQDSLDTYQYALSALHRAILRYNVHLIHQHV